MADHCVLDYSRQPPRLICIRCRCEESITLPMPIRQLVVISDSFVRDHRNCRIRHILISTPSGHSAPFERLEHD